MGGRGGAGVSVARAKPGASKDGTIIGGEPRKIESYFREARGRYAGYYNDEILEAKTDGNGNLTIEYAKPDEYRKNAKTNRTVYTTYTVQAGAVNGEIFGIDFGKVKSISGKTYPFRKVAKENGLSWDGTKKQWRRK